jgi:hypothetical protein
VNVSKDIVDRAVSLAVGAATTAALGYFSVVAPETNRANANREGNYTCRDSLYVCMEKLGERCQPDN